MDATQVYVSEFIGTAVLLAMGNGTNASVLLKSTLAPALRTNWIGLLFGWMFAVTFGVYTGVFLGGPAHLNPALTIAFAYMGSFPWDLVIGTIIAQVAGAFVGAALIIFFYYPQFKVTTPEEGNGVGIFATGPMIDNKFFNVMSEIIATFFFLFLVLMAAPIVQAGLLPLVLGFLVGGIGLSFGSTTGFAINPCRDFGPRLAYTILPVPNRGPTNWQYAWVPIVGPIIGALLAVMLFMFLQGFLGLQ